MMYAVFTAFFLSVYGVIAIPPPWKEQQINILMPEVQPQVPDTYLCKAVKVEDDHRYITEFIPNADAKIAHHVLLYGCEEPGAAEGEIWNCGEMASQNSGFKQGSACKSGTNIVYAWAMEAPRLALPEDVSFDIGQETAIKYLVVQVHYKNVTKFLPPENGVDSSGLTLLTSQVPTGKQAGVYLMLTGGNIAPQSVEYFETACTMDEDVEIVPFAYRTHAHTLGRVISGYRVRDGKWTEIGRKDPRLPEMFYNTTNPGITVRKGDILAARCTMENGLDHTVSIGSTQKDEMCNFYIMYYVNRPPVLKEHTCGSLGPPNWYWQDFQDQDALNLKDKPSTISVIPGTNKPLLRTERTSPEQGNRVEGMPGWFNDITADQLVNEAIREMDPEDLMLLIQKFADEEAQEEEAEREARRRLWIERNLNMQAQRRHAELQNAWRAAGNYRQPA